MSAAPSQTIIPEQLGSIQVRQHMLEDGTIIDIPAGILRVPPPKPAEFLYLKHYYQRPSGVRQELKEAGSAEAAIDILADELEGMRHLLCGYVNNFEKYVDKFDAEHEAVQKDILSIVESYNGLRRIVKAVAEHAPVVDAAFLILKDKVCSLRAQSQSQMRPPPKIVQPRGGNGQKNPKMTPEETKEFYERYGEHRQSQETATCVTNSQDALKKRVQLAELITPPSRSQADVDADDDAAAPAPCPAPAPADKKKKRADKGKSKSKGKAKAAEPPASPAAPIDPRVEVKIEKLVEGLDAMREAFQRVHAKTERDLMHLRVLTQKEKTATEEIWKAHDEAELFAFRAGKTMKHAARCIEAYDRWATKALEDQEAQASQATDAPAESVSVSDGGAASTAPSTDQAASQGSSAADSEAYTVSLNLRYDKDLDKLTREEAIEMLKALPLRIHFTPFGTSENEGATATEDRRVAQPQVHGARQGASDVADASAVGAGQPPEAEKSNAGTQSRKRGRASESESEDAGEKPVDARVAAGGSPVKKMRVQQD
ncbi:hypothetical protein L226DRAFT_540809 [Lentinus tigrinus ALCF2SS1-7]|uniref:Uncharacterized protein n=1 Tax=Lentinus tigrinus ALCF2SS1-6 TaxID=1328759 RepID=A0A5C2RPN7_9APHY|nr:hypothetical protein L227DRAFT_581681 [Lentinus tigrinus ALCF2SS1-6]RPD68272.1 hypothetical protein L226DRAFT_540809 [Lentinus tigrinus ALCF2SS1-7]